MKGHEHVPQRRIDFGTTTASEKRREREGERGWAGRLVGDATLEGTREGRKPTLNTQLMSFVLVKGD
jgi:hypothetical protein